MFIFIILFGVHLQVSKFQVAVEVVRLLEEAGLDKFCETSEINFDVVKRF